MKTAIFTLTFFAFCICAGAQNPAQQNKTTSATERETIHINANAPVQPFPHFWEQMFGSGRATLSLRANYRRDLRDVEAITGFQYVRFHGIFDHDTGLYSEDANGNPVYNFSYVDQIYDGLLENGVKPYVEISFMPPKLASREALQAFWYHPNVAPPKSWTKWDDLITTFANHLVARYGINEVAQWYFEVWNEPNIDFWAGEPKQQTYFELYDHTARALKAVSPRLRVGGPSTAQAAWVPEFIAHVAENKIPADFVSTHVYGNDTAEHVFGTTEDISREDMVCRAARKVHDQVKASAMPNLPVIFSEYNASYSNEVDVTDSVFMGPWLANTIRECNGLTKMMSYWTFSDVFEEQGIIKKPFYGGFGLVAEGGIPKPAFNAFRILHMLGTERLTATSDASSEASNVLVTRRRDGALVIAVWNYSAPDAPGHSEEVTLDFSGLPVSANGSSRSATIYRVDAQNGNALAAYRTMGSPASPTQAQYWKLRKAGSLAPAEHESFRGNSLTLELAPKALDVVVVPAQQALPAKP